MDLEEVLQSSKKNYDLVAEKYKEAFAEELAKKEFDRELLNNVCSKLKKEGKIILDVGCGSAGHVGKYIFDKGFSVMGIDISEKSVELAKKVHPEMAFKEMNMLELELKESSVQAIIAFYSIIHIPKNQITKLLEEFRRVLEKGGRLVLAVHEGQTEEIVTEMLGKKTTLFVSFYTENELIEQLKATGFKIDYSHVRKPYDFEHQTNRIYIIAKSIKKRDYR